MIALRDLDTSDCRLLVNFTGIYNGIKSKYDQSQLISLLNQSRQFRLDNNLFIGADNPAMTRFLENSGECPIEINMFLSLSSA